MYITLGILVNVRVRVRVKKRLRESAKHNDKENERESLILRWCWWWCYCYPPNDIRFTYQCYLWFAIFKSNDYLQGWCRYQLGRLYYFFVTFTTFLDLLCTNIQRFMPKNLCTNLEGETFCFDFDNRELKKINCLVVRFWPQKLSKHSWSILFLIRIRTFVFRMPFSTLSNPSNRLSIPILIGY